MPAIPSIIHTGLYPTPRLHAPEIGARRFIGSARGAREP
jgi:hypothetical protein